MGKRIKTWIAGNTLSTPFFAINILGLRNPEIFGASLTQDGCVRLSTHNEEAWKSHNQAKFKNEENKKKFYKS